MADDQTKNVTDSGTGTGSNVSTGDLSNLDVGTLLKIVKDLRDENASRRVSNKELSSMKDSLEKKVKELEAKLSEADTVKSRLEELEKLNAEYKKLEEEKKKADLSEVEKLKLTLQERESKLTEKEKLHKKEIEKLMRELEEKDNTLLSLRDNLEGLRIQNVVNSVLQEKGFKFRSEFEKRGLLNTVLKKKEDSSYYTDEEVASIVSKFVDDNFEAPSAPPGKPAAKPEDTTDADISRFRELRSRRQAGEQLTSEERVELAALVNKLSKLS
jgi:DNA repair exonuclease SbcCD ATPase subunit